MRIAFFVMLVVAVIFAPVRASAECVTCANVYCSYLTRGPNGEWVWVDTEAPRCMNYNNTEYGYENCTNVSSCGGCMGWTCTTRDPQDTSERETAGALPRERGALPAAACEPAGQPE